MMSRNNRIFLMVGFVIFLTMMLIQPPSGMSVKAWHMVATVVFMAILWISESLPMYVTALFPIMLLPIFDITPVSKVTLSYANESIFLFMGGFMIAIAMEASDLHRRFALYTISLIGKSPARLILGFMITVYLLSMWVSNTATVLMVLPVCMVITKPFVSLKSDEVCVFEKALLLSIAYAASIGGIATLIGTPPNIILSSILNQTEGLDISFAKWMLFAVPVTLLLLFLCWILLVFVIFKINRMNIKIDDSDINKQLCEMGKMSQRERRVLCVFGVVALMWIFRGFIPLEFFQKSISDTTIAIAGAIAMFVVTVGGGKHEVLLSWESANRLPWGILLLFGGGLAISEGFKNSGLSLYLASMFESMGNLNVGLMIVIIITSVVFVTEIMSNTATSTLLIPISITLAGALGLSPLMLAVPITMAASMAFMLPVATPPNAIVFNGSNITIKDMVKAGFWLNITSIIVLALSTMYFLPLVGM